MNASTPTVIIVGAGAGGISAAARLAKHGYDVTVVEQHDFVGGRCSLIRKDGYRFDQGPSLLLIPEVFHRTFRELGTSLEDEGVKLLKCETNYNVWFPDKTSFAVSTDLAKTSRQIERIEGEQGVSGFLAFIKEAGMHYDLSMDLILNKNFSSLMDMLRPAFFRSALYLHALESSYSRASRYFKSEKMRQVFTFASMYLGMSPFEAPSTYNLLQYTEMAHGIAYPVGGFQKVLEALAKVGERFGANFRLKSPVSSVILSESGNTARGVRLESGEELFADVVLINADLVYAYNNLLPPSPIVSGLNKRLASCSSISFFWSFDRIIPELLTHNIFMAENYRESFDAIFKRHQLPEEPSFYVNVPSRIDPSAAPAGRDAVVVLVPVGHLHEDDNGTSGVQDWDSLVDFARDFVMRTIEARTGARNLRESLVAESVETPPSWKNKFNLDRGAILGLSHDLFNVLCFRPRMKHDKIRGLYFVGASTHPGTGVPVCMAGGRIVSDEIMRDMQPSSPLFGCMSLGSLLAVFAAALAIFLFL
ncbi:Phytoene desaturase [Escovopsis weberi]|uniref:Phytoene desaturase n=1 Tax=Escovopsis weberi TaxID=150374 RepID=A0A0M9VWA8_ESCWE|nr:Phytoene desaturase [Escovopsis weberi]